MKKGDVGMAKYFSKKYGNKGWACILKVKSTCLSVPEATSLHHSLQNHRQYYTILSLIQALDTKRPVASLAKADLLGHGQSYASIATPSSTVHNTKHFDPYHWNHSWSSDVGM